MIPSLGVNFQNKQVIDDIWSLHNKIYLSGTYTAYYSYLVPTQHHPVLTQHSTVIWYSNNTLEISGNDTKCYRVLVPTKHVIDMIIQFLLE